MTRSKDRAVENAWRVTLGLLIFAIASCGVVLAYHAFFAAINTQWAPASVYLSLAFAIGWSVTWLCVNRNDLAGLE